MRLAINAILKAKLGVFNSKAQSGGGVQGTGNTEEIQKPRLLMSGLRAGIQAALNV
jgi:hypothetical protein